MVKAVLVGVELGRQHGIALHEGLGAARMTRQLYSRLLP